MMIRMKIRTRVTVSLPAELVNRVDREARARRSTRSAVMSDWLRRGAQQHAAAALDAEITAYYSALTEEEAAENEAIAKASLAAARRLDFDERQPARPRARRRRSA
jgi:metal-responsive CopG/Arc/MetJ family transcriptional regulator